MSTTFIILILLVSGLSLFHFLWSSTIMPTYRQLQRNKLFTLRDELRRLHINKKVSEQNFNLVHEVINYNLKNLGKLQLIDLYRFRSAYHKNPAFKKTIDKELKKFSSIKDENLNRILDQVGNISRTVCNLNSGGWLVYVIPLIIAYMFARTIKHYAMRLTAHESFKRTTDGSSYHHYSLM